GMEAADKKEKQEKDDEEVYICGKCEEYRNLGEKLIKGKYINIYEDESGIFNKYGYDFDNKNRENAIHRMKIDLYAEEAGGTIISSDITHLKIMP
ncbi:MAG: hypothetical protein K2N67_05730, partial [Mucispirillum sp.]|nr:hypothetical protein [Mucispirillum sp.]